MDENLQEILHRLNSEERDHAELKKRTVELQKQAEEAVLVAQRVKADADKVAAEFKAQLDALEASLGPLIEVAPVMQDFAATGRVGYLIGKWIIGIAGFFSAAAVIYYAIVHGFRK
jgi:putative heme degradation protein